MSMITEGPLLILVLIIQNVYAQVCIDKDVYQWDIVMTGNSSHSAPPSSSHLSHTQLSLPTTSTKQKQYIDLELKSNMLSLHSSWK